MTLEAVPKPEPEPTPVYAVIVRTPQNLLRASDALMYWEVGREMPDTILTADIQPEDIRDAMDCDAAMYEGMGDFRIEERGSL